MFLYKTREIPPLKRKRDQKKSLNRSHLDLLEKPSTFSMVITTVFMSNILILKPFQIKIKIRIYNIQYYLIEITSMFEFVLHDALPGLLRPPNLETVTFSITGIFSLYWLLLIFSNESIMIDIHAIFHKKLYVSKNKVFLSSPNHEFSLSREFSIDL